jgi:serine/threonine-protein kinase
VTVAFAFGFWSVRQERGPRPAERAVASANDWAAAAGSGSCPAGLVRIAGGPLVSQRPSPLAAEGALAPRIAPFCLGRWEVTVAEYEACAAANVCEPADRDGDAAGPAAAAPALPGSIGLECNSGRAGRERYPINCVSFLQAQRFCAWRGGRLPNEAEWEYAAEDVTPDPGEGHKGTLPVGSFPAGSNPEGVLDLFGNVSEWTSGRVGLRNPTAGDDPNQRQLYAVLGGGLQPGTGGLGSHASRLYMNANARGRNVGFRCAYDP